MGRTKTLMEIHGWNIDFTQLSGPARSNHHAPYLSDELYASPLNNLAALIYSIAEVRMGWEVGRFALFQNKNKPACVLNPDGFLCFATTDTVTWFSENVLALKTYVYPGDSMKLALPFTILDLTQSRFSFIRINNSLPYSIILESDGFKLKQNSDDPAFPSVDGREFEFSTLMWHPNKLLSNYVTCYFSAGT